MCNIKGDNCKQHGVHGYLICKNSSEIEKICNKYWLSVKSLDPALSRVQNSGLPNQEAKHKRTESEKPLIRSEDKM